MSSSSDSDSATMTCITLAVSIPRWCCNATILIFVLTALWFGGVATPWGNLELDILPHPRVLVDGYTSLDARPE